MNILKLEEMEEDLKEIKNNSTEQELFIKTCKELNLLSAVLMKGEKELINEKMADVIKMLIELHYCDFFNFDKFEGFLYDKIKLEARRINSKKLNK